MVGWLDGWKRRAGIHRISTTDRQDNRAESGSLEISGELGQQPLADLLGSEYYTQPLGRKRMDRGSRGSAVWRPVRVHGRPEADCRVAISSRRWVERVDWLEWLELGGGEGIGQRMSGMTHLFLDGLSVAQAVREYIWLATRLSLLDIP